MPTITEFPDRKLSKWSLAASCALALAVWFGGLMLVWAVFEPTRTVVVFAPGGVALASAEAVNVDLLDGTARFITVSGRAKGFVRQLYESGAWIVLPVTAGGCRSSRA
jgi:hypothetical protein